MEYRASLGFWSYRCYSFPGVIHHQVGRQYIQIIRCRRVPLIIEKVTQLLRMQWGGGRVNGEGFKKEKMLELGFEGYVEVSQVDSGGREFQAEGTACVKSVSEV